MFEKIENQKALKKLWENLKAKGLFAQLADYEDWKSNRDRKLPKEKNSLVAIEAQARASIIAKQNNGKK